MPVGVAFRSLMAAAGVDNPTWDVIDSTTLGSAAASISFASIDSKYKLFRVTAYIIKDGSAGNLTLRLNNDSGTNYDRQALSGSSTSVTAERATGGTLIQITNNAVVAANQSATVELVIAKQVTGSAAMVVGGVTYNATVISEHIAARWNNTADLISRIDLISSSGNFAAGTTCVLEGLPS